MEANTPNEALNAALKSMSVTSMAPRTSRAQDVGYYKVVMTPALAADILAAQANYHNRKVDPFAVARLASLMRAGKWVEDVDSIKITRSGRLIDGQHRLHAIVSADRPIAVIMSFGITEDVIKYVDTGRRRTSGQTLQILGNRTPAIQLATANLLAHFEYLAALPQDQALRITTRLQALDPDAIMEIIGRYAEEFTAMEPVLSEFGAASVLAPLVYAAARYPKAAKAAMEFIRDGQVGLSEILQRFHGAQKRMSKAKLGSGTERGATELFILGVVQALQTGKAPRNFIKVSAEASKHQELLAFFSVPSTKVN